MTGEVTTLFWDVGGVILSNGWDIAERREAARHFHLNFEELEPLHAATFPLLETGKITLAEYLDRTFFLSPQPFTMEEFTAYMFAQSSENPGSRAVLDEVTALGRYLLVTLNNEGRELNEYRIAKFQLTRNFAVFLSSCYLGVKKPNEVIYRAALGITQRSAAACLMIDDRPENLESPQRLGMRTIHFQSPAQLRAELIGHGILGVAAFA